MTPGKYEGKDWIKKLNIKELRELGRELDKQIAEDELEIGEEDDAADLPARMQSEPENQRDEGIPQGWLAFLLCVAAFMVAGAVQFYDTGPVRQYHGSARGALLLVAAQGLFGPNGLSYVMGLLGFGLAVLVVRIWWQQRRPTA